MIRRNPSKVVAILIILGVFLAACLPPARDATIPQGSIVIREGGLTKIGDIAAGISSITFTNRTGEVVTPQLLRLPDEESTSSLITALSEDILAAAGQAVYLGGARLSPEASRQLTYNLKPGIYLAVARVGTGMLSTTFQVPKENPSKAVSPAGFVRVEFDDLSISISPESLATGMYSWEITPSSQKLCELNLLKLNAGVSITDVEQYLQNTSTDGPAPFITAEAVGHVSPGQVYWVRINLDSGDYLAACSLPGSGINPTELVAFSVK